MMVAGASASGSWSRAGAGRSPSTRRRDLLRALAAVGNGALTNAGAVPASPDERERLASITLNIGEGVCAVDAAGRLIFVNPAAAEMIELPDSRPGRRARRDP